MRQSNRALTITVMAVAFLLGSASFASAQDVTASEELLLGSWSIDFAATAAAAGAPMDENTLAMMAAMNGVATFNADHTMTMEMSMMGESETESGSWSTVSASGNMLTISAVGSDGETDTISIVFNSDNDIAGTSGGETILFRRVVVAP